MAEKFHFFLSLVEVRFVLVILGAAAALDIGRRFLTLKRLRLYKNFIRVFSRKCLRKRLSTSETHVGTPELI